MKVDLSKINIVDWSEVKPIVAAATRELPDLLLGNGFSMNFSSIFSYKTLFKEFSKNLENGHKDFFEKFDTVNFETILKELSAAENINKRLGLDPEGLVNQHIEKLKDGFIKTIKELHPKATGSDKSLLNKIAENLNAFGDIFTTNYDLFLYHLILISNDNPEKPKVETVQRFKAHPFFTKEQIIPIPYPTIYRDYFSGGNGNEFTEFREKKDDVYRYKYIHYLHGALFIFNEADKVIKLKRNADLELIDTISDAIKKGKMPIFVSEGHFDKKNEVVKNNQYLNFCIEKLKESHKPILIFGHTLSKEFDAHIVKAIKESNRKEVFFAVYTKNRTQVNLEDTMIGIRTQFEDSDKKLVFVNSETIFPFN